MTGPETADGNGVRLYPPPPKDFNPFTATRKDLKRHGLPLRPDPQTQPGLAALWERKAGLYRTFEHLEPRFDTATAAKKAVAPTGLPNFELCGYQLISDVEPFTALFVTWTVPDLRFTPSPTGVVNHFHTFVGLGDLDVHTEMTVDSAQNITSHITATSVGQVNLPVGPGDVISATLCLDLDTEPPGTAHYFFANETTAQTVAFAVDTGFFPAHWINAGVSRSGDPNQPPSFHPLASFGTVYFDEIGASTTSGSRSLTSGGTFTMVDENGSALAEAVKLNDRAFKTVHVAA